MQETGPSQNLRVMGMPTTSNLSDRAHAALLDRLRDGRLRSGTFLSMPVLVDLIGLPIAAMREAVKRAEASGLLTIVPKRGVAVMDAGPQTTRDCLELRTMFDCEGARRIIASGGAFPLAALRETHHQLLAEARADPACDLQQRAIRTDLSLHDALARGLDSPLAARLYGENRDRIAVIQNTRPFVPDRIAPAMEEHLAILDAIEARDSIRADAAIRYHLRETLRWWGV